MRYKTLGLFMIYQPRSMFQGLIHGTSTAGRDRRITWKREEVDELLHLIRVYGLGDWTAVMKHGSRTLQHRSKVLGPFLLNTLCSGKHVRWRGCPEFCLDACAVRCCMPQLPYLDANFLTLCRQL